MKELARRYRGQALFVFVYIRDAHCENGVGEYLRDGIPVRQAANLQERRQGAELHRGEVEPERFLLLDGFGSESLFEHLFCDDVGNPMLVVGADGRVRHASQWADAEEAARFLPGELH